MPASCDLDRRPRAYASASLISQIDTKLVRGMRQPAEVACSLSCFTRFRYF